MHSLRLTVVRRSSSMMPNLIVLGCIFSACSTRVKIFGREGDLVRSVRLRLDHVNRTESGIPAATVRADTVERDQGGDP